MPEPADVPHPAETTGGGSGKRPVKRNTRAVSASSRTPSVRRQVNSVAVSEQGTHANSSAPASEDKIAAPVSTNKRIRSRSQRSRRSSKKPRRSPTAATAKGAIPQAGFARNTWRRFLRWAESWGGSAVFHAIVLILLSIATLSTPKRNDAPQIVSSIERSPEELNERLDESLTPATMLSTAPSLGVADAQGELVSASGEPQLSQEAVESVDGPEVSLADVAVFALPGKRLTDDLGADAPGDPSAAVEGYGGALDRITQEILMMLTKGKVLVIWLLDQSESMEDDRQEVRARIERVYQELGLRSEDEEKDALLTAITSFGQQFVVHSSRPTADLEEIQQAIDSVPNDDSGQENVCQAVIAATREFRRFATRGRRQIALIIVTDEAGDDGDRVEQAIAAARDARARIYTMGREAVFGYPYAHIRWTWVDPEKPKDKVTEADKIVFWIRIRRGPETPRVEQLQTDGLWRRYDAHPSGFGPYELVRMCRQTGGIYFMLPSVESNLVRVTERRIYELDRMRPYLPDLSSRQDYIAETASHPLRQRLWDIIGTLNPYAHPEMNLREYYSVKPDEFAQQATVEKERAGQLLIAFQKAEEHLQPLTRQRNQETSLRWQANYDLLLAQVVAYQMRLYEYVAYLDAFLQQPKQPKSLKTNRWRIHTVQRTLTHEDHQSLLDRSKMLLQAVIDTHPGTPYAARAQWELNRGFGISVAEYYYDPRRDTIKRPNF